MVVLRMRDASGEHWSRLLDAIEPLRAEGLHVLASRRLDIARAWDLDGVHLAADSVPVEVARRWLPDSAWIGYSAHCAKEAQRVAAQGASYVTVSPIYPTKSKPGARARGQSWLNEVTSGLDIPVLALGGITAERVPEMLSAGASGVAAVSAIGAAPEPETAARSFSMALTEDD